MARRFCFGRKYNFMNNLQQKEIAYLAEIIGNGQTAGGGRFTANCCQWLENKLAAQKVLLTNSCTAALQMAVMLSNLQTGDEVIMPSFNFPAAANAVLNCGGVPVFADIRPDTLNIDATKIEAAITPKTRAIVVMHYGGVPCEMDSIMATAQKHKFLVIEDAAQSLLSTYKGRKSGTIGDFGCFSFHATKNVSMGEGGALVIKDKKYNEQAEHILYKGTNRNEFAQGKVSAYTWVEKSGSFLPSELNAAYLWAQLENAEDITRSRLQMWNRYYKALSEFKDQIICPFIPEDCEHNAHIFWLLFSDKAKRDAYMAYMRSKNIVTAFHFQPLHSSPMGLRCGRFAGKDEYTTNISQRIVRLPLSLDMSETEQEKVVAETVKFMRNCNG